MIARLRAGQTSEQDINFYMHELKESALMAPGVSGSQGGPPRNPQMAAQDHPTSPATSLSFYHPEVIAELPEHFNPAAWPQMNCIAKW